MFSSATTEPLSEACYFDILPSDDGNASITNRPVPAKMARSDKITAEVKEAIAELLEAVPKLADIFTIVNKIGAGTFSSVYLAELKQQRCNATDLPQFALKHIIPTSHPSRIESELRCLQEIGGEDNVMNVSACVRVRDHVVIVMPYFQHDKFVDYVSCLSVHDVRDYMHNLLLALRRVHSLNIIHRDIKPSNFLFNRKLKKYTLVDFGLAQRLSVSPKSLPVRVAGPAVTDIKAGCLSPTAGRGRRDVKAACPSTPLSARPARTLLQQPSTPLSRKRKTMMSDDAENSLQSPRKRHPVEGGGTTLMEISNTPAKRSMVDDKRSMADCGRLNQMTPPTAPDLLARERSPRRLVLTKRALMVGGRVGTERAARRVASRPGAASKCQCYTQPTVCTVCMARTVQRAPRAGTPGFRSPEVLMRFPDQTTAVDIWSVGVIFLSLLTARYPFFKASDDLTALAQMMSIFGTESMKEAAATYGKNFLASPVVSAVDLQAMCQRLSVRSTDDTFSSSAYTLLASLLDLDPARRITAADALNHPFFTPASQ